MNLDARTVESFDTPGCLTTRFWAPLWMVADSLSHVVFRYQDMLPQHLSVAVLQLYLATGSV